MSREHFKKPAQKTTKKYPYNHRDSYQKRGQVLKFAGDSFQIMWRGQVLKFADNCFQTSAL